MLDVLMDEMIVLFVKFDVVQEFWRICLFENKKRISLIGEVRKVGFILIYFVLMVRLGEIENK